jgi:hypothetical protein
VMDREIIQFQQSLINPGIRLDYVFATMQFPQSMIDGREIESERERRRE